MNFTQFLLILNARKWVILGVLLVTVATTAAVSLWLPKEYTATSTLLIDSKSKDAITGQMLPSTMFPGYMATQVDVINSPQVAGRVVSGLKLADTPGTREQFMQATEGKGTIEQWLADLLLKKLDVEPSRESSLIRVNFTGTDPQFAAAIANAFAKAYIDTNLDLRVAPAKQTAAWFDEQINQLRASLEAAQTKLSAYQREKGVVLSDERLDIETAKLGELSGQVVAAQSAAYDALSRKSQHEASAEVANNSLVQNLKVQMAQSEARLAELEKKTGKNHPEYQRAVAQLDSIKRDLDGAIRTATRSVATTASAAQQRLEGLRSAVATQKTRVLEMKKQRDEIAVLVRDVENAQRIYDSALQRYGQTRMEAQSTQTDIAVLNPAIAPTQPSKPRVILNLLLSLFLGTLLGVGTGFLVELLDRRVRSGQDIAAGLDIPVLAEVRRAGGLIESLRRLFRRSRPAVA
jgi:chain length determinant protein EpsF